MLMATLVSELPPGSRIHHASLSDDMWTTTDYLLAELIDAQRNGNWLTANQGAPQGKQSEPPEPTPRPRDLREKRDKRSRTQEQARAFRRRTQKGAPDA